MADMYEVPKEVRQERIESLAKKFDLYNALSDQIQSYSHGMRQKSLLLVCSYMSGCMDFR